MKISKDGTLVTFHSREPFFSREKEGLKCNTVRTFKDIQELEDFVSCLFTLVEIEIMKPYQTFSSSEKAVSFRRLISDITYYDGLFIISWQHRED